MDKEYYTSNNGLQVIDMLSKDHTRFTERQAFYFGNVLKYICRAGIKDKTKKDEDFMKALDYFNHLYYDNQPMVSGEYKEYKDPNYEDYVDCRTKTSLYKEYVDFRIKKSCLELGCISNYYEFLKLRS